MFCILVKSQTVLGNFSLPPDKYSIEMFDKSIQNVYYQLNYVSNPKSVNKKEVICVLELGKNFSKFFELNTIKYDSLAEKFSHQNNVSAKEMNQILPVYPKWKPVVLRDLNKNSITIQDKARDNYQYTEEQPAIIWKLGNDTKSILGYTCYKATAEFRGRKYTAWYSKDIPINNGPYLFNGLPGLIMEIEDRKNHYHFTAIAMDKKPMNIYLRNEDQIFKITRKKFREIQKTYHDNPAFFHGSSYDAEGNVIRETVKAKPYNPIELD